MSKRFIVALVAGFVALQSYAGDSEANEAFSAGREKEKSGDSLSAADKFMEAQLQADDPTLKANSLMNAARAYRKAGRLDNEFDCLERLVKGYPNKIDYKAVVDREYEIADEFFAGHRDVALSWLPFIKKEDKTMEFYEIALKNAPCSAKAPEAMLRLGRLYLDKQESDKAIARFNDTVKLHPGAPAARYASLELSNTLLQLSRKGDGDGKYAKQAIEAFDQFLSLYPKDTECGWVRRAKDEVNGTVARRLHGLGQYYHRMGRDDIAEHYFAQVVKDYPKTESTNDSEDQLAKIDESYSIPKDRKPYAPEPRDFKTSSLPYEESPIITVPENSDGKWLLPVRDLKYGVKHDNHEPPPKRSVEDDAL